MLAHARVETKRASRGSFVDSASLKGRPVSDVRIRDRRGFDARQFAARLVRPRAAVVPVAASRPAGRCTGFSGRNRPRIVRDSAFADPKGGPVPLFRF